MPEHNATIRAAPASYDALSNIARAAHVALTAEFAAEPAIRLGPWQWGRGLRVELPGHVFTGVSVVLLADDEYEVALTGQGGFAGLMYIEELGYEDVQRFNNLNEVAAEIRRLTHHAEAAL